METGGGTIRCTFEKIRHTTLFSSAGNVAKRQGMSFLVTKGIQIGVSKEYSKIREILDGSPLSVTSSGCGGFGIEGGESFGGITLRLCRYCVSALGSTRE